MGHGLAHADSRTEDLYRQVMSRAAACGLSGNEVNFMYLAAPAFGADYAFERYPLIRDHVTGSEDGKPLAPLLGDVRDYDGGATDLQVGPVTFGLLYCDHAVIYRFTPLSIDRGDCDITWLVRGDAEEGRDYDLDRLIWLWDVTTEADKRIIERNSEGVNSRFYRPGPYGPMESSTRAFAQWYLEQIRP